MQRPVYIKLSWSAHDGDPERFCWACRDCLRNPLSKLAPIGYGPTIAAASDAALQHLNAHDDRSVRNQLIAQRLDPSYVTQPTWHGGEWRDLDDCPDYEREDQ